MPGPYSYILCGTPRTGSTLLCSLLRSTGVAGRPESYFRQPGVELWAPQFGVDITEGGPADYPAYVAGAVRVGSTANGVFAARIMWGTMQLVVGGLAAGPDARSDVEVLEGAMGPLRFVHLHRRDVLGQAVSWGRAEQSGYWQQGERVLAEPRFDHDQIDGLVATVNAHNEKWRRWFADESVQPLEVTYEDLVARPMETVEGILEHIEAGPPLAWPPTSPHERQADATNEDWVRRYRAVPG